MTRIKSTFMVDTEVYKRIRILAIERDTEVSAVIEEAMREKLEREYPAQYLRPSERTETQTKNEESKGDFYLLGLPIEFTVNLPGIKFPTNKAKIIEYGEKANTPMIIGHLTSITNKTYKNKTELKDELIANAKTIGPALKPIVENGFLKYKIDDREIGKSQYQQKILEQQNELTKLNEMQKAKGVINH